MGVGVVGIQLDGAAKLGSAALHFQGGSALPRATCASELASSSSTAFLEA